MTGADDAHGNVLLRPYIHSVHGKKCVYVHFDGFIRVIYSMWRLYNLSAMVLQSDRSIVSRHHLILYSDEMYDAVQVVSGPRDWVRLWLVVTRFGDSKSLRAGYSQVPKECYHS